MSRPAVARIHLDHIVSNYQLARSLHPQGNALAVIKADGYGHGAVAVAHALAPHVDVFAVACIEEALELRQSGIEQPVLLLEGFFDADELTLIDQHGFWTAIHRFDQIDQLAQSTIQHPIPLWIKVDTGMHRLGFSPEQVTTVYERLSTLPQVGKMTLMTHFANADCHDAPGIDVAAQIQRLQPLMDTLDIGISLANSAALMDHPEARQHWQRPGIMLYGACPLARPNAHSRQLKPAMTLQSEVIAAHWVEPGESVGYGSRFVAKTATLVGTVAMGYADGYPRQAQEGTPVAVDGHRTRLIGRVSMDMLTIDLTPTITPSDLSSASPQAVCDAQVGRTVELWGEHVPANDVATCCDTIAYHLFTGVTRRVPRRY